jgi:hypothetical protein
MGKFILITIIFANSIYSAEQMGGNYSMAYDENGVFVKYKLPGSAGHCSATRVGEREVDGVVHYVFLTATHCFCARSSSTEGQMTFSKASGLETKNSISSTDFKLYCQSLEGKVLTGADCRSEQKNVGSCKNTNDMQKNNYNDVGFVLIPKNKLKGFNDKVKYPQIDCANSFSKEQLNNCQFQGLAYGTQAISMYGKAGAVGQLQYGHYPISGGMIDRLSRPAVNDTKSPWQNRFISYETYITGYRYNHDGKAEKVHHRGDTQLEQVKKADYGEQAVTVNPGDSGSPLFCSDKNLLHADKNTLSQKDNDFSHLTILGVASYYRANPLSDEDVKKKRTESYTKDSYFNRFWGREKLFEEVFGPNEVANIASNCVSEKKKAEADKVKADAQ